MQFTQSGWKLELLEFWDLTMVRFLLPHIKRPVRRNFIPDYNLVWVSFDHGNVSSACTRKNWSGEWEAEDGRDFVHRQRSKHEPRYNIDIGEGIFRGNSTLAIILIVIFVTAIILPQIMQIFVSLLFKCNLYTKIKKTNQKTA